MALINCPECGHQMSDSAKKCPNCGYKKKITLSTESRDAIIKSSILLVIGLGLLFLSFANFVNWSSYMKASLSCFDIAFLLFIASLPFQFFGCKSLKVIWSKWKSLFYGLAGVSVIVFGGFLVDAISRESHSKNSSNYEQHSKVVQGEYLVSSNGRFSVEQLKEDAYAKGFEDGCHGYSGWNAVNSFDFWLDLEIGTPQNMEQKESKKKYRDEIFKEYSRGLKDGYEP